ncbi:MAG: tyrosine--tRNA ligase [Bacteriovoracaceae bacterium]|nr:tyrosine--tRNA ligase [Bacteriovoracaceae bacterium]
MKFYEELESRGLIADVSNPELRDILNNKKIAFYIGYDPTAKSLQIGNLFAIVTMKRFQEAGHKPYVVLGGATGMIGDPSGKSTERVFLTEEIIKENIEAQQKQFKRILKFDGNNPAIMVNNFDWMGKFSFIEFLRDVGKKFRITEMLAKESVKNRIESEVGLSFTEFCYQMLQAYDFRHLALHHDVVLQMGGGDQWGNITAGIEYTRKMDARQVYGLVIPLVTDSHGNKFGKSEGGTAIYLDPEMTSPYQMYQFLLNSEDTTVNKYLKYFTFLSLDEISLLEEKTKNEPHLREAQKVLASEVVKLVHGDEGLNAALKATKIFFGEKIENLKDKDLNAIFKDVPSVELPKLDLKKGIPLLDLLAHTPLFPSKSEARRSVEQKGVYFNNDTCPEMATLINESHLASETCIVLRKGKKNYCVIKFV